MSDPFAKLTPWLRFVIPLAAVGLMVVGTALAWSYSQVREREALLERIESAEGRVVLSKGRHRRAAAGAHVPLLWRVCGAEPVSWLMLPDDDFGPDERHRIRLLFPEARLAPNKHPAQEIRTAERFERRLR